MKFFSIFITLICALFIFASSPTSAQAATCTIITPKPCWSEQTELTSPRRSMGVAADANGKIYVAGGYDGANFVNILEVYDPTTGNWTQKAPMPTNRNSFGFAFLNGKFYTAGGFEGGPSDTVYEYNPQTNQWTTLAPLAIPRYGNGLVAVNNKLYAVGGFTNDTSAVAVVEEYNPATNTWTSKSSLMPTPRGALGVVALGNKVYAIGGHLDTANNNLQMPTVEVYDPLLNIWTTRDSLTVGRSTLAVSITSQGRIYAIGGDTGDPGAGIFIQSAVVEEYYPLLNIWRTRAPLPTATMEFSAALGSDNNVHTFGGWTDQSGAVTNHFAGRSTLLPFLQP